MMNYLDKNTQGNEVLLETSKIGQEGSFILKCFDYDNEEMEYRNYVILTDGKLVFSTRSFDTQLFGDKVRLDLIQGSKRTLAYLKVITENESGATAITFTDCEELIVKITTYVDSLSANEPYDGNDEKSIRFEEDLAVLTNTVRLFYKSPLVPSNITGIAFIDLHNDAL